MKKFLARTEHDNYYGNLIKCEKLMVQQNKSVSVRERHCFRYKDLDEEEIPAFVLAEADEVLYYCKTRLKMPDLWIQWMCSVPAQAKFRLQLDRPFLGMSEGENKLTIRADVPIWNIRFSICHEAHHCWFGFRGPGKDIPYTELAGDENRELWESTANGFAMIILNDIDDRRRSREERL